MEEEPKESWERRHPRWVGASLFLMHWYVLLGPYGRLLIVNNDFWGLEALLIICLWKQRPQKLWLRLGLFSLAKMMVFFMPFFKEMELKLFQKLILLLFISLELVILLRAFTWRINGFVLVFLFLHLEIPIQQLIF